MEKASAAIILTFCAVISGCHCTVTSREYSIPEVKDEAPLPFEEVSDISAVREWESTSLPIEVTALSRKGNDSKNNNLLLWLFTLGVIPRWDSHEYIYSVYVRTPVGRTSGFCKDTERVFGG